MYGTEGSKDSVTSPWPWSGVRRSSTWRNRICELQDSDTRGRARRKTIVNIPRWLRKQREHGLLRLYCNSADETAAGGAAENFPDPRSMTVFAKWQLCIYYSGLYVREAVCEKINGDRTGTFTPIFITTTGGMADECVKYHSRLAKLIANTKGESYSSAIFHHRTLCDTMLERIKIQKTTARLCCSDLQIENIRACPN